MWDLMQYGRAGDDPAFWLTEFAAPDGCEVDDRDAWRTANRRWCAGTRSSPRTRWPH
jgi:hypothetical protein